MAKISTYPILSNPTINDILIGTDVEDLNITKNFSIGSIIDIIGNEFVPYVGATGNVNLGAFNITASSFIVAGGSASQFLKANGTLDSTVYVPASRTLTINSITFDLSANRSWDLNTIDTLTTIGTSGAATYIGKTLNIPQYQAQGSYITQLSGEATAVGPGNATVTLSNLAVISKVLTGLNITGGTVTDTDSILTAFGKVQNQINGLAGGVTYQGTWNAATNTPTLTSSVGTKGFYYVVSVPGNTNLNGITDWKLGDWAIFNGSTWEKVDNTDAVVSVNGYTGAVVLTFSDVGAPPATRTLTINGTTFDLTADRSWTVGDVRTDQTYSNPTWISSLAWGKITGTPTTLAGYGITDGVSSSRTLTINGTTFDLSANRTWNVGTVTSVGTSGPLTGGTITGSGTIGITQAGASSDGYLSSTDWNTFNNKQNALTNPVTGTGTIFTLPMWSGATSLVDSPLSYGPDTFNFQYNSATGGTVNFTNIGLTAYTYSIQMNNFGSPRSTVHSYTDGVVVQSIGGTQVSRVFANGNTILGAGVVDNGYKLEVSGNLYVNSIVNATTDTDRFIVSDGGLIKYRTGAQLLSDIGGQGSITLTTTGSSGPATLVGNTLNIPQYTDQFVGTVTSVGLSMPSAFTVSNSPVTSAGTLTVVGAGTAAQYVRGDGTLGDFPGGGGGGGASVSYYLNGSVNQGTFVGNTYYEMNKVPIFGAGTDFNINTNGYIAQFITDANDPDLLLIPGGNWNLEFYFSASSGGGSPTFYVELYKYNGTTFTLIASNSTNPELISLGTTINPYFSTLGVPETVLAATDRLAIRIYVTNAGRTITLHTENSHLCQVITTFTTGLTALNGITKQVQYLTTGTSGTDFNILSAVDTHTFNLPTASAVNRGALSAADWSTFNNKQATISLTTTGSSGSSTFISNVLNVPTYTLSGLGGVPTSRTITINGTTQDLSADRTYSVGTVTSVSFSLGATGTDLSASVANSTTTPAITLNVPTASASARGALSSTDWSTFNSKQNAITLTTTGTSGAATLVGSTLNIPQYQAAGTYVTAVTASSPLASSGGTTPNITIQQASGSQNGFLSSTDWTTFNNKQNALTNPVTGTGTTNYLPKFTGSTTIGNSNLQEVSGNLGLGVTPSAGGLSGYVLFELANGGASIYSGPNQNLSGANISWVGGTASYKISNFATLYNQQTGQHQWFNAPSGTAGNAISFTQAMTLTSGGNLLLGTTTDIGQRLQVSGGYITQVDGGVRTFLGYDGSGSLVGTTTNHYFRFITNDTERMRITSGGNVGINNVSPAERLAVGGAIMSTGGITGHGANRTTISQEGLNGAFWQSYGANSSTLGTFVLRQASSDFSITRTPFGIDSTGAATFSTTSGNGITIVTNDVTTLKMNSTSGTTKNWGFATTNLAASDFGIYQSTSNGGDAISAGTPRLYFSGVGNVGIGTTSPQIAGGGYTGLHINGNGSSLVFSTLGSNLTYLYTLGTGGVDFAIENSGAQIFRPGGNERARITSGGNVLIGTATDNGGGQKLQVNGSVLINAFDLGNETGIFFRSGAASSFKYNLSILAYDHDAGGSADGISINGFDGVSICTGANTRQERFRVTSGGNLLVGTTTDAGFRLDVNGTGRFSSHLRTDGVVQWNGTIGALSYGSGFVTMETNSATQIRLVTNGTTALTLATNQAATFSSSVTANARSFVQGAAGYLFDVQTTDANQPRLQVYVDDTNGVDLISGYNSTAKSLRFVTGNSPRMTITSGGNVLIGTTTDNGARLNVSGNAYINNGIGTALSIDTTVLDGTTRDAIYLGEDDGQASGRQAISWYNGNQSYYKARLWTQVGSSYGATTFGIDVADDSRNIDTRLAIRNGNVLIGTLTSSGYKLDVVGNAQFIKSGTSTAMVVGLSGVTGSIIRFSYNGGFVGSISTDGSNTAYNTSSDYRLKEQIRAIDNPLEKVLKLNPVNFKYKNSKTVQDGFIAHEIQEILPYLVTGEKDGAEMQEVDYSKLTPILIAAIKELKQEIDKLRNK